jgi:hypothetical protein
MAAVFGLKKKSETAVNIKQNDQQAWFQGS